MFSRSVCILNEKRTTGIEKNTGKNARAHAATSEQNLPPPTNTVETRMALDRAYTSAMHGS